jgi:hypothetical protein
MRQNLKLDETVQRVKEMELKMEEAEDPVKSPLKAIVAMQ